MKYFVVADVHGFYDEMIQALNEKGFDKDNPNHCLVSCGDLFDRGPQPNECIDFVLSLDRCITIRGNHEDLMEDAIRRGYFLKHDQLNGTIATATALTNTQDQIDALLRLRVLSSYNKYIRQCRDYYETHDYIFVHGWIPCWTNRKQNKVSYLPLEDEWRLANNLIWQNARWINGMEAWAWGIKVPNKTIVCGHWHASWGNHFLHHTTEEWPQTNPSPAFDPFIDDGIIALDACTAFTHRVNCIVIDD